MSVHQSHQPPPLLYHTATDDAYQTVGEIQILEIPSVAATCYVSPWWRGQMPNVSEGGYDPYVQNLQMEVIPMQAYLQGSYYQGQMPNVSEQYMPTPPRQSTFMQRVAAMVASLGNAQLGMP